tara:strand:- start:234 stop:419 length:186 start_codon:yes stop_codon:yes gene_type:complete
MKVKCLKNVCASGVALESGKTYDISDKDAQILLTLGSVEKFSEKSNKQKKKTKPVLENGIS